jgi:hypothetical protein
MTRRWFFLIPLSGWARAWGAGDFWNRKSPRDWDDQERLQLITESPWAQDTRVDPKTNVASPIPESSQAQTGGAADKLAIGARTPRMVVCWDSAKPILDALGNFLPRGLDGHYVIGVTDREQEIQPLKASASLSAKGKEPVQASAVVRSRDGATAFFAFSKELLPLTIRDKDVLFSLDTDRIALKAKFDPKEMIYRGNLAL